MKHFLLNFKIVVVVISVLVCEVLQGLGNSIRRNARFIIQILKIKIKLLSEQLNRLFNITVTLVLHSSRRRRISYSRCSYSENIELTCHSARSLVSHKNIIMEC